MTGQDRRASRQSVVRGSVLLLHQLLGRGIGGSARRKL